MSRTLPGCPPDCTLCKAEENSNALADKCAYPVQDEAFQKASRDLQRRAFDNPLQLQPQERVNPVQQMPVIWCVDVEEPKYDSRANTLADKCGELEKQLKEESARCRRLERLLQSHGIKT